MLIVLFADAKDVLEVFCEGYIYATFDLGIRGQQRHTKKEKGKRK